MTPQISELPCPFILSTPRFQLSITARSVPHCYGLNTQKVAENQLILRLLRARISDDFLAHSRIRETTVVEQVLHRYKAGQITEK